MQMQTSVNLANAYAVYARQIYMSGHGGDGFLKFQVRSAYPTHQAQQRISWN